MGGEECTISAENIVIMDCPGKAFGLLKSEVSIANSLITRCNTGGEFHASLVQISDSYSMDIPDADHVIADNDNDGLYFYGPWSGGTASNALSITVANSLITNCQQGIEAGWREPEVIVDHCTVLNNQIGLRLGDSYDTGCFGSIDVTNSIFTDNDSLNIRNYDPAIEGPRENAISITYSCVSQKYQSGNRAPARRAGLSSETVFIASGSYSRATRPESLLLRAALTPGLSRVHFTT